MNNSINFDVSKLGAAITMFIKRFHTIIFFLVVSGGLFAAIVLLVSIINLSSTKATSSNQIINGSFDEETITRLKQSSGQITPGSRQSPFVE